MGKIAKEEYVRDSNVDSDDHQDKKLKKLIDKVLDSVEGVQLGNDAPVVNWLSTGNFALNKIISGDFNKGFPFKRIVDIFGVQSSGKSMILYHALAEVQKLGGLASLDDIERSYMPNFGAKIGIDNSELFLFQDKCSVTVEEHFERMFLEYVDDSKKKRKGIVPMILDQNPACPIVVALDSLAALSTRHEKEVLLEKPDMTKAKVIRAALRIITEVVGRGNVLYLIANHITDNVGVLYGPKKTTPGGSAVPFYASVRLELSKTVQVQPEDSLKVIGVDLGVYTSKNKVAPPFREATIRALFDSGIDPHSGLLDVMVDDSIVVAETDKGGKRTGTYSFGEEKFTKKTFGEFLLSHPQILGLNK